MNETNRGANITAKNRAADYRKHAEQAEHDAKVAGDSAARAQFLKFAHAWRNLADQVELALEISN